MSDHYKDPKYWDKSMTNYQRTAAPFTQQYARSAWDLLAIKGGTLNIIDIACGTGAFAEIAAHAGHDVTAIDFAAAMVAATQTLGMENIDAYVMNATAITFADASFDISVSMFGVVLVPDWQKALSEMARVTKIGGKAMIGTWPNPNGAAISTLMAQIIADLFGDAKLIPMPSGMSALMDESAIEGILKTHGLTLIAVHKVTHNSMFLGDTLAQTHEQFKILPHWANLSEDEGAKVLARLHAIYEAGKVNDPKGDYLPIPSPAFLIEAVRH